MVIINLIVITKGAGRVSEVAARFTLDAMPGKQMAIDADLNAGIITSEEAKTRRNEIAKEGEFYGAMDGAAKFVKGDAIAGILILLINIIGGLIIGSVQHDLSLNESAETYILLTLLGFCSNSLTSSCNSYCNHSYKFPQIMTDLWANIKTDGFIKGMGAVSAVLLLFGLILVCQTLYFCSAFLESLLGLHLKLTLKQMMTKKMHLKKRKKILAKLKLKRSLTMLQYP